MSANPFHAGGPLTSDSPCYVARQADAKASLHIQRMEYITLVEPRQQGKTSLINRLIGIFSKQNYVFCYLDLSTFDGSMEAAWYQSLGNWIIRQLRSRINVSTIAPPTDGNSWRDFLADISEQAVSVSQRVVIIIDEVGAVPEPWATHFFSTIRSVYNSRESMPSFKFLSFIVAGAYDPKELIKDSNISNFNVDHRVPLSDFSRSQTEDLVSLMMPRHDGLETSARIFSWTAGHPYITQHFCYNLYNEEGSISLEAIDQVAERFFIEDTKHLPRLLADLNSSQSLLEYARGLLSRRTRFTPSINEWHFKLAHVIGLISVDDEGYCCIRNFLYQRALQEPTNNYAKSPTRTRNQQRRDSMKIRILHLSDLHEKGPREKEPYFREQVLGQTWEKNLQEIAASGPIDLICCTGDLAHSGQADEYKRISDFLAQTAKSVNVDFKQLFLVPGNHDVARTVQADVWDKFRRAAARAEPFSLSKWMAGLDRHPPAEFMDDWRKLLLKRQAAFWNWVARDLKRPELRPAQSPHGYLGYRVTLQPSRLPFPVHIIGLDTSWLAGNDQDAGNLRLTIHQVMALTSDPKGKPLSGLRIALMHHPLFDLADRTECQRALAERVDCILRGHLHEPEISNWVDPDRMLPQFAAGCLYEGYRTAKYPNGCQIITLNLDGNGRPVDAEIHFRTWSDNGHWYDNNAIYRGSHNGRVEWNALR